MRISFIVSGALLMFGAWFAFQRYVSDPYLRARCQRSCSASGASGTIDKGYVASKRVFRCSCGQPLPNQPVRAGFFFSANRTVDWVALVLFRLVPISVILFVGLFTIAKTIERWQL